jgi:hypothetical protein
VSTFEHVSEYLYAGEQCPAGRHHTTLNYIDFLLA